MIKLDKSLINTIEAFLLTAGRPLTVSEIRELLNEKEESIELGKIRQTLSEIEERHRNTSLCLSEVASGFRLQVKDELSESLSSLWSEKTRLSRSLMETLAIIAYRQPVTRGDIEDIRGVQVSTKIIRNLLDKNWIKISGHRDTPGRPAMYVTTKNFLDDLNLTRLSDLPELPEIEQEEQTIINTDQAQTG
mgnify:FL=1